MFEKLKAIDEQLFLYGNSFHTDFFDVVVPYLSDFWIWIPLFIWWLVELYKKFNQKIFFVILLVIGLIVATDQSSVLIKNTVKRYRPTHNTTWQQKVHTVNNYRGGQYGYVSSHAANAFGIAFLILLLINPSKNKWLKLSLLLWACIFSFTRIYLGVHYPFDLISGALLGLFFAFLFYKIFCKFIILSKP